MFRTYYFSEMPYPATPDTEFADVIRTLMPNRWVDPDTVNQAYNKYLDIIRAADEFGLDVMFNEHHQTMSNLVPGMPLLMSIAARETKRCRLLALGNPVANRPDPVRVAAEMAMVDVLSNGRLECGFVKGAHYEISATNSRPTDVSDRLYEAIDLIVKAWTTRDGPFTWEGEHYHHRQVTIVPRPYQQPHPPIWSTSHSTGSTAPIADRGYVMATMFCGTQEAARLFNFYRERYAAKFGKRAHPDRLAYCAFIFVGDTDEEALRAAPKLQDFLKQSFRVPKGQMDVPGYFDIRARAAMMQKTLRGEAAMENVVGVADPRDLVDSGIAFWGSPDSVFEQLKAFFYSVGGFTHLLGMGQAANMTYDLTTKSLQLFAKEVLPRFREEVYNPWIKENGFSELLVPTGDVQVFKGSPSDLGSIRGPAKPGIVQAAR